MIKRQELVNDILDLYDYIDALEKENKCLKDSEPKTSTQEKPLSFIDCLMIEKGKEKTFRNVVYSWNHVDFKYNEETDTYDFTRYNVWLDRKIQRDNIPNEMSYDEFITYFRKELQEMYAKEKEESLKREKENE